MLLRTGVSMIIVDIIIIMILIIIEWSFDNIKWPSDDHLYNIWEGLIISRRLPAINYQMKMWWSFEAQNWSNIDLLLIIKQTNKQTNCWVFDENLMIILLVICWSFHFHIIMWLSNDHIMLIKWLSHYHLMFIWR